MKESTEKNGGVYSGELTKDICTHLLVGSTSSKSATVTDSRTVLLYLYMLHAYFVVVWLWIVVTWWCTSVAFCVLLALPYPSPSSHLLALFLSCSP